MPVFCRHVHRTTITAFKKALRSGVFHLVVPHQLLVHWYFQPMFFLTERKKTKNKFSDDIVSLIPHPFFLCLVKVTILNYQSPTTGLFPVKTCSDCKEAKVRDSLYCAASAWALALAYR